MPNSNEQMETRVMKVTMKKEAFDLFDKGELHSDSGIRDSQGKIRVHPDIEPYVENDISQDDKVLLPQKSSTSVGQQVGSALAEVAGEIIVYVITNPDVHRAVAKGVKSFWKTKVFLLLFVIESLERGFSEAAVGADDHAGEAAGHLGADELGVHAGDFTAVE